MTPVICFLYFSALMILNCEFSVFAKGDASLYARHMRFQRQMESCSFRWRQSYSVLIITVGAMLFGVSLPLVLLLMLRERLRR